MHAACSRKAESAIRSAQRVARGVSGELVLGFVEAATMSGILPDALARFARRAPLASVELREATSAEQVDLARRQALDVGLVYIAPPQDDPVLQSELLWTDPLVAVLPATHPLSGRRSVRLADLGHASRDLPLICFRRTLAPQRFDDLLRACMAGGYVPDRVQQTTQFQSVVNLVSGGVGIGLAPASFRVMRQSGVSYVALPDLTVAFGVHLIQRRDEGLAVVQAFVDAIREAVGAMPPR